MSTVIIPTCLRHVSKFSGDPRSGLHRTRQPREYSRVSSTFPRQHQSSDCSFPIMPPRRSNGGVKGPASALTSFLAVRLTLIRI